MLDQDLELRPPVDWTQDPIGAHRFRQNLFKLRYLEPSLSAYEASGDPADLEPAVALALDFVENVGRGKSPYGEAWTDKVTGDRAPVIARLVRDAACAGLLDTQETEDLLASAEEHAVALVDEARYEPDNHGLFVDLGLYRLAEDLSFLDGSGEWQSLARTRFTETLRGRLADGVWLEHSSGYHLLALDALERMIELTERDRGLRALREKMRRAAHWFVEPDGDLAQFGDSDLGPVPGWARKRRRNGLQAFPKAGYAVVRAESAAGPGYLAVTAGFHNLDHKHADELSFELYDRGTRIVSDTGMFHKDPGRVREFVVSPEAHSTVTVDGREWPIGNNEADYGSGLMAAGEGAGWYGVMARNELVERQGVEHTRGFLYRPGAALIVVDRLLADERHEYVRRFHLGPELRAAPRPWGAELSARGLQGRLVTGGPASVSRGDREALEGLTSPSFRRFVARPTVSFSDDLADATLVTVFDLDGSVTDAEARWRDDALELRLAGSAGGELHVRREGATLLISPRGR